VRVLQLHMWETTVQPLFVYCRNLTGYALTLVVTYSVTDGVSFNDASVYVRKLDFQANLCKAFAKDKNAALLWRLGFGMGSFAKDRLELLVNSISIKTLKKLPTVFTWLYIDLQLKM